jgi:UDP-N-acetyl-D-glucosamine/UDP-N-acetyl-D-galactosamine dehydrogenase
MGKIGIIGLGYVGLPLAVEFVKIKEVIGFDINETRIAELKSGNDSTLEIDADEFKAPHAYGHESPNNMDMS